MSKLPFGKIALASLLPVALFGTTMVTTTTANASIFGGGGRTASWVFIRKSPDEGIWEACRRVYGRDVYQVRGAGARRARCFVDASSISDPRGSNFSNGD